MDGASLNAAAAARREKNGGAEGARKRRSRGPRLGASEHSGHLARSADRGGGAFLRPPGRLSRSGWALGELKEPPAVCARCSCSSSVMLPHAGCCLSCGKDHARRGWKSFRELGS